MHALVVGVGRLEGALRDRASALGIADRVRVVGAREDVLDVMAAADVFALSSDWEALPLVLVEAMIGGAAVVTTDVGGVTDIARDGDTALVVPPRDAAALTSAIARLLADDELRRRLAAAASSFVEVTCSPAAMVDGYLRVYSETLDRRRTRSRAFRAGARPSK
jgi:glycosyltransferase involved in cell wall biosynthesis